MKKFTTNFSSGGYRRSLRILRSVALGLVALVWVHSSALAQRTCPPPPNTVHFYAGDVTACYNETNLYKVDVSVMDFYNVDSLNLFLDYDETYWTFESATVLHSTFTDTTSGPNGQNDSMKVTESGGVLNFSWAEWVGRGRVEPVGDNTPIVELVFSLKNFPNNTQSSYENSLEWLISSKVYHCGGGTTYTLWTDNTFHDGAITTNVIYDDILYTIDPNPVDCANNTANVVITAPAVDSFSFNGGVDWTGSNEADAFAGVHVIQVKDANGCLSVRESFTVNAVDPVTFTTRLTDEGCGNLGEIEFVASGGTAPYTYWVVPENEINPVWATITYGAGKNDPSLDKYKHSTEQNLVPAGGYWVAIDDVNECIYLGYNWMGAAWQYVEIDQGTELVFTDAVTVDTVTCYNGTDGEYVVTITQSDSIYNTIVIENVGTGVLVANKDSVMVGIADTTGGLAPGTYQASISNGICTKNSTFTIYNTDPITFYVQYTDAPCTASAGTLWISEINGDSLKNTTLDTTGWTYRVVGGAIDTIVSVSDTLTGLPANYYSAWLVPGCGEVAFVNKDGSGNTIPILDNGAITFNVEVKNETCFGDADGFIRVTDVDRSCENCNEGAFYQFRVDSAAWLSILDTAFVATQDTFWVEVRDSMDPAVCIVGKDVIVAGPDSALTVTVDTAYAPTCHMGNDGWVKMYVSGGVPPYEYSVDNAPNWRPAPSFGLTEGAHLLQVRDAVGCLWEDSITVETLSEILITATLTDTIACPGDVVTIGVVLDTFTWFDNIADYTFYYSETSGGPWVSTFVPDTLVNPTGFAPGTYYIQAKDLNGCWASYEDTVVIEDVLPLIVDTLIVEDAECYDTWSGSITLNVLQGSPDSVFYYAMVNNIDALNKPDSLINWVPFHVGDTTETIEVKKGEYWLQVKASCDQKSTPEQAIVGGYDPIEIASVVVEDVMCYGGADGTITVTATGGAPGAGIGNYLYTLKHNDTIVGVPMQTSNVFTGLFANQTCNGKYKEQYTVLVYDSTDPNATPSMCTPDTTGVNINQPGRLQNKIGVSDVTCADAEDGVISVYINGGVGGMYNYNCYNIDAATDGKAYKVTINGITGDRDFSLELDDAQDVVDFQVYGGDFEVIVEDANGCNTIDTVTVLEPKPWVINTWYEDPSDCNVEDGIIWASATGGYDGELIIWDINEFSSHASSNSGDTVELFTTAVYNKDYAITVYNQYTGGCVGTDTITLDVKNPFEFEVDVECVKCYGDSTGTVTISNITGGAGAYQIQLVGGENPSYDSGNDDLWWPKDSEGDPLFVSTDIVFADTLAMGDYWIYLRDSSGFTLANCCRPIKFTMCQPDSLELITVMLVNNVECAGDSTGAFSIQAEGGIPPYKYTYTRTELSDIGFPYPGIPEDAVWVEDSVITGLPSGLYVGWVMDANGCITGCEINAEGAPIDDHRVAIREAGAIEFDYYDVDEPLCYGGLADIEINNVTGGSGDSITFKATGTTYMGMDTVFVFAPMLRVDGGDYLLEDVLASDNYGYIISAMTSANCEATGDTVWVNQPDEFSVSIDITSGAICEGDKEVLIVLSTAGGDGDVTYDIWKDDELIREDSEIPNHVVAVGAVYTVIATDENGCTATDTMDIQIPQAVSFKIKDVSCNGDELASARVIATGTPDRMFTVWYQYFEGGVVDPWVQYNGEFQDTITMLKTFVFDDENLEDVHYAFKIIDDNGCESGIDTLTFDKVQHPIEIVTEVLATYECTADILLNVFGGIEPYVVTVDGDTAVDMNMTLSSGIHTIVVTDDHLRCVLTEEVEIVSDPVVRDTTIETFIGEATQFVDAEAGLDTMLTVGMYSFVYMDTTAMCDRTLNVDVVEVPKPRTIAEIQGDGDVSPIEGEIAKVTGTVTAVVDGEGFFVQDANDAWSGLWIEYSAVGVVVGDGVEVVGAVAEIANVTSIVATEVNGVAAPLVVEAVVLTSPSDVSSEMYESVLAKVEGARAKDYDPGTGEWTIMTEDANEATVNNWLYDASVTIENYYDVTGVVNGRLDNFKLEPRMDTDVVDLTATSVDPDLAIEFKVYPNPFGDIINIVNHDKLTRVVISNIAGQRVIDVKYPNSEIRTDNLVSGVYLISLITEEGIAKTERIIKK